MMLMLLGIMVVAHAQTCRDKSNLIIGKIEADGTVRNASNLRIGKFDSDGAIRNASNILVGRIDGTSIRDK